MRGPTARASPGSAPTAAGRVRVWPPEGTIDRKPRYVYGQTQKEVKAKRRRARGQAGPRGLPKDPDQTVGDYFGPLAERDAPAVRRPPGRWPSPRWTPTGITPRKHIVPEADGRPCGTSSSPTCPRRGPGVAAAAQRRSRAAGRGASSARARPNCRRPRPCRRALSPTAGPSCTRRSRMPCGTRRPGWRRTSSSLVTPPAGKRQKRSQPPIRRSEAARAAGRDERGPAVVLLAGRVRARVPPRRGPRDGVGRPGPGRADLAPRQSVQRMRGDPDPQTGRRRASSSSKELKTETRRSRSRSRRSGRGPRGVAARAGRDAAGRPVGRASLTWCSRRASARPSSRATSTAQWERICRQAGVPRRPAARSPPRLGSYLARREVATKVIQRTCGTRARHDARSTSTRSRRSPRGRRRDGPGRRTCG